MKVAQLSLKTNMFFLYFSGCMVPLSLLYACKYISIILLVFVLGFGDGVCAFQNNDAIINHYNSLVALPLVVDNQIKQ